MSERRDQRRPAPVVEAGAVTGRYQLDSLFDWALGLSAVSWAVRAVVSGQVDHLVPATIAAINLTAGLLFIARRQPQRRASLGQDALCLGSVVIGGVALKLAPAYPQWPRAAALLFAGAGVVALGSLVVLGRSFGVFPAFRGLVARGPFALIRHPIYLAELTMVGACSLAVGRLVGLAPFGLAIGLVVVRVVIEERLLYGEAGYRSYAARVRWRLLPGLW